MIYAGNNAGSNSSGGGGSVHTSDGTGMRSPGVILGLKTVENKQKRVKMPLVNC